jgi:hypothetical protein
MVVGHRKGFSLGVQSTSVAIHLVDLDGNAFHGILDFFRDISGIHLSL